MHQRYVSPEGMVKEQAWVEPEMAEALSDWMRVVEKRLDLQFANRAEGLRAFFALHLGLLKLPVHMKQMRTKATVTTLEEGLRRSVEAGLLEAKVGGKKK